MVAASRTRWIATSPLARTALALGSSLELELRFRLRRNTHVAPAEPPVFIVGCAHSGTTLLLKILGAHSRLHAIHYESGLAFQSKTRQRRSLVRFEKARVVAGKRRFVEKTPRHVRAIPELAALCPGARFVAVVRDGRDVACSLRRRTGSLSAAVARWVEDNRHVLAHRADPNLHVLRYEDLLADFEGSVSSLLRAIGERWEPELARFYRTPLPFQQRHLASPWLAARFGRDLAGRPGQRRVAQIHQPLYDARGRWRKEMTPGEMERFQELARDLPEKLGYLDGPDA